MNKLLYFIKSYWCHLLILMLALAVFGWTIQGALHMHLTYMDAKRAGNFLGMGEMRVNEQCVLYDDGSILLEGGGTLYGPYFDFSAGVYQIEVTCESQPSGEMPAISITADGGVQQLGTFPLEEGENVFGITLDDDQKRVEFVLRNEIEDRSILVTRLSFLPVPYDERASLKPSSAY